jgi:hypothetical protein
MNRSFRLLIIALPLLVACNSRHSNVRSEPSQAAPAKPDPGSDPQASEAFQERELLERDAAIVGISPDDPILQAKGSKGLSPEKRSMKTAFNTLIYTDVFVWDRKREVDEALEGRGDLEKASKAYELALLRSDLIHGDVKAGRMDKATLRVNKMTQPMTQDEQALLEARNASRDVESLVRGTIK